ncbi:MAG: MGMT family protein [Deltaproteobacteria bacterium]|nr:MGMT family protein [Deltaproteobacteria bacterium]
MSHPPPGSPAFLHWLHDRSEPWNLRVYAVTRLVPAGHLTTYGDIGSVLGSPRFARQVGWALAGLGDSDTDVPWHRVINAKGSISYRGDVDRGAEQLARLEVEGVLFDAAGRCDLARLRWPYPRIDRERGEEGV